MQGLPGLTLQLPGRTGPACPRCSRNTLTSCLDARIKPAACHPGVSAVPGPVLDASLPHLLILGKSLGCVAPQKALCPRQAAGPSLRTPTACRTCVIDACFCAPRSARARQGRVVFPSSLRSQSLAQHLAQTLALGTS